MLPKQVISESMLDVDLVFLPDIFDNELLGVTIYGSTVYNADGVWRVIEKVYASYQKNQHDIFDDLVDKYADDCVLIYLPYVS